jgi:hypothetical protein
MGLLERWSGHSGEGENLFPVWVEFQSQTRNVISFTTKIFIDENIMDNSLGLLQLQGLTQVGPSKHLAVG